MTTDNELNNNQQSDQLDQQPDEQLNEGGLKALQSERAARKQLEKQLGEMRSQFNEVKGQVTQEYQEKMQALYDKLHQSSEQLRQSQIAREFYQHSGRSGVKPQYSEMLLRSGQFKLTDDGKVQTSDGQTLDDWFDVQKQQLPDIFEPPKRPQGAGSQQGQPTSSSRRSVSFDDTQSYLANLDAIANGEVDVT